MVCGQWLHPGPSLPWTPPPAGSPMACGRCLAPVIRARHGLCCMVRNQGTRVDILASGQTQHAARNARLFRPEGETAGRRVVTDAPLLLLLLLPQIKLPLHPSLLHDSKCRTGWFTEPTPFFTGGLSAEEAEEALDEAMEEVMSVLADMPAATGGWVGALGEELLV